MQRIGWVLVPGAGVAVGVALALLSCGLPAPAVAQAQHPPAAQSQPAAPPQATAAPAGQRQIASQAAGSLSGTVLDQSGAVAVGAKVQLTREGQAGKQEVLSGDNGQFSFSNLPPGPFHLTVSAAGFNPHEVSGELQTGEAYVVPPIMLSVATAVTSVRVGVTPVEIAEAQIKEQEQQRVLGFIPNFYVTYVPNAAPLVPRQKFELAWKSTIDPISFLGVGALAGIEQAADEFGGYGQGAEGYGKRFGAAYADVFIGTFIDSAILPSLLKQDPRYFYQGTGSTRSRLVHAISNAVMCKGDNQRYQVNYSAIIGSFITGGISYTYYPPHDRGAGLLVRNSLIRIGEGSVAGIFQEFVLRKLTPHVQRHRGPQP